MQESIHEIQLVEFLKGFVARVASVADQYSDRVEVLLFDVAVVVLSLGPATRQCDSMLIAIALQVVVDELGAVVRTDMIGRAVFDEQIGQAMLDSVRVQLAVNDDDQTLSGKFVDHSEHAERLAIVRAIHDEVIGPDMVGPRRSQTDTRSVIKPQPAAFRLFLGNLQPLPPPDALNPFSVYLPTFGSQQGSDPSLTVSAILAGQAGDRFRQSIFVRSATRYFALG